MLKTKPAKVAPTAADWRENVDDGDLLICHEDRPGEILRVEVKVMQKFTFTNTWPYRRYFICSQDSWDRADPKPHCYIQLSRELRYAGFVLGSDHESWKLFTAGDHRYGPDYRQTRYWCEPKAVRWLDLGPAT